MRKSEVYLRAAKLCNADVMLPSCWAVENAGRRMDVLADYREFMLGYQGDVSILWGPGNEYTHETQNARVLALLFMHWIARDEERDDAE